MRENFQFLGIGEFIFNGVKVNLGDYREATLKYTKDSIYLVLVIELNITITLQEVCLLTPQSEFNKTVRALEFALESYKEYKYPTGIYHIVDEDSRIIEDTYVEIYGEDRWFNSICVYDNEKAQERYSIKKKRRNNKKDMLEEISNDRRI